MGPCFITLAVLVANTHSPATVLINPRTITAIVQADAPRSDLPTGYETRIYVLGGAPPLITTFSAGEVAALPCREYQRR